MTSLAGPRRTTLNPWWIRLPILFFSGVLLLALVLTIFLGAFQLRYVDKIVPNVWALGVNLSGLSIQEAAAALSERFTYDTEAVFTFRDGDRFWQMTAADLGVSFDARATAEQAYAAGHSRNFFADLVSQAGIWFNGRSVPPTVRYDQNFAVSRLTQIAAEVNRPTEDATLTFAAGVVRTTASQTGRTLDITATLQRLQGIIVQMDTGAEIALVVNETPPLVWEAETAAARIRAALSAPLTLVADDGSGGQLGPWTANSEQIASLLSVALADNGDGTRSYQVSINTQAIGSFLETLAPGLITTPVDGRFHYDETSGQLQVLQPSRSGRALNVQQTLERLEAAVFATDPASRTIPLAFDYTLPRYHEGLTAAELGITQLVAEATTYYTGSSQARRDNIALAASRFDGIIIGPGEEFSYNYWLGDVSPEAGFVEGFIIQGGRTVRGVGGGVCQVSTTAFQAAFYAGFPVLERYAHGYRVGYYEAGEGVGMDAAIYTPDFDFRFLNDTPYHLLIETSLFPAQNAVQFRYYSTNPGRTVVKEGPLITGVVPHGPTLYEANPQIPLGQSLQVDWAADGADVTVTRIVLDLSGNEIRRDTFFSHYEPWQAILQVSPSDPILQTQNPGG
ncbi:MAG: VanW family protein [Chloroflexi bacterium]|nr:VanW family protein [Chloroflexota bacterium]